MRVAQVSSAFLTPVLAVLAGYIAWQQYRTNRNALTLNLFDRRFKVYRGLMDLLAVIADTGNAPAAASAAFIATTNEKRFLFARPALEYMQLVRQNALKLRQAREKRSLIHTNREQDVKAIVDEIAELCGWFDKQIEHAPTVFEKYLSFKNVL